MYKVDRQSAVLVRLDDAQDELMMSHGDYHAIKICDNCNDSITSRIKTEEKQGWTSHQKWCKDHPQEAMQLAQAALDMMSGGKDGLEVRDILPDLK